MNKTKALAIETVMGHEGGYTVDHAGATNYGVTVGAIVDMGDFDGDGLLDFDLNFDGTLDNKDILAMDNDDAKRFYSQLWDKWGFDRIATGIAPKYFNLAVNMGLKQATRIVQRACRAHGQSLVDDGICGPKTRAALSAFGAMLFPAIRSEAAGFYRFLVARNPGKYGKFLRGWLRRAYY